MNLRDLIHLGRVKIIERTPDFYIAEYNGERFEIRRDEESSFTLGAGNRGMAGIGMSLDMRMQMI